MLEKHRGKSHTKIKQLILKNRRFKLQIKYLQTNHDQKVKDPESSAKLAATEGSDQVKKESKAAKKALQRELNDLKKHLVIMSIKSKVVNTN